MAVLTVRIRHRLLTNIADLSGTALTRGADTAATIRRSDIVGTGPKTSGWAENGVQVDQGATAQVRHNTIADHWWDNDDWASSGVLALSDGVQVQNNAILGNDAGVYATAGDAHVSANEIVVEQAVRDFPGFDGMVLLGTTDARVVNNAIRGDEEAFSGILLWGAIGTNLINNDIEGFQEAIERVGDEDTTLPPPFDPA